MTKRGQARTTVRIKGGGLEIREAAADGGFDVNSAPRDPVRSDPRYTLQLSSLGRLERLARAQWLNRELAPSLDTAKLDRTDADTVRNVALSVYASSDIEGEAFATDQIETFISALTEPGEHVDSELNQRLKSHIDIVDTYFWACNSKRSPIIDLKFIQDIHKRMFVNASPGMAGQLKSKPVKINYSKGAGAVISIPTVPADRAKDHLIALCDRTNRLFELSEHHAEASKFLAVAEFACDFLAIHPFHDGNGRTARLLSVYLLEKSGYHFTRMYPLDQIILDSRADYYEALYESQRYWHTADEDLSPWVEYFIDAVFEQWERAFWRMKKHSKRGKPPHARAASST